MQRREFQWAIIRARGTESRKRGLKGNGKRERRDWEEGEASRGLAELVDDQYFCLPSCAR
jgi:hypothetical protein